MRFVGILHQMLPLDTKESPCALISKHGPKLLITGEQLAQIWARAAVSCLRLLRLRWMVVCRYLPSCSGDSCLATASSSRSTSSCTCAAHLRLCMMRIRCCHAGRTLNEMLLRSPEHKVYSYETLIGGNCTLETAICGTTHDGI